MKMTKKATALGVAAAIMLSGCGLTPRIDMSTTYYIDNVNIGQEIAKFEQLPQEEKDRVIAMIMDTYKLDAALLPISTAMNRLDPLEIFFKDVTSKQAEEAYKVKWSKTVRDTCKLKEGIVLDPIPAKSDTYARKELEQKVFHGKYAYATYSFVRYLSGIGARKEGQVYTYTMTTPGFIQLAKDDFKTAVACRDAQITYYYPRFKDARTPIEEASLNAIKLHWNYISDIDAILEREAKSQNKVFSPKVNVKHAVRALPMPKPEAPVEKTEVPVEKPAPEVTPAKASTDEKGFNTDSITGV